MTPTISIITACYNAERTIARTLASVAAQKTSAAIEYLVIDGGSSDRTCEVVRSFGSLVTKLVSEPDRGIADAWNKGLALATGTWIYLLNADDEIAEDFVEQALLSASRIPGAALLYTDTVYVIGPTERRYVCAEHRPDQVHLRFGFFHTTVVVHREVYERVGIFNISYRIALDIDFLLRCHMANIPFIKFFSTNFMAAGGISDLRKAEGRVEYREALKRLGFSEQEIEENRRADASKFGLRSWVGARLAPLRKALRYWLLNSVYGAVPSFGLRTTLLRRFHIEIGHQSYIHAGCRFFASGNLKVGHNSVINKGCYLDNRRQITVGNNVSISHDTRIYTLGHDYNERFFRTVGAPVSIEDDVVIFANAQVMPGVTVGKGAVVLTGSVVTKSVAPYQVVGGNPAAVLRERNHRIDYLHNYHSFLEY